MNDVNNGSASEKRVILFIPIKPLSVNMAWQGKRFKSKAYHKYQNDIDLLVKDEMNTLQGDIQATYRFYIKNFAKTDGDNLVKCIQDILVRKGYIEDDRKIVRYIIEKHKSKTDRIEVIYESVNSPEQIERVL